MFLARIVNMRTGRETSRELPKAEEAAQHLALLLRLAGCSEDPAHLTRRLVAGSTVEHKGFAYSVAERQS